MSCPKCKETQETNQYLKKIIALIKGDLAYGEKKLEEFIANAKQLEKKLEASTPDFPFGPIPHWVKCSERLPEQEGDYLVKTKNQIFMCVCYVKRNKYLSRFPLGMILYSFNLNLKVWESFADYCPEPEEWIYIP